MSDELDLKLKKEKSKKIQIIISLIIMVILFFAISLFVGSSSMTVIDAFKALLKQSTPTYNRIMWSIRMPRVLAALIAGAGLSVSGLIMQTVLGNQMASPFNIRSIKCRGIWRKCINYCVCWWIFSYRKQY